MEDFLRYIDMLIEEYAKQEQELIKAGCKDEANFVKIKINICDICKTLYNVSLKKVSAGKAEGVKTTDDKEFKSMLKEEYIGLLTKVPANWEASYQKAKEHGDAEKIVIEESKLEVLQRIKNKFLELIEC